jgi:hypothetical protein
MRYIHELFQLQGLCNISEMQNDFELRVDKNFDKGAMDYYSLLTVCSPEERKENYESTSEDSGNQAKIRSGNLPNNLGEQ